MTNTYSTNEQIDEEQKKLLMYITYHYEDSWASEKDILDAMEKDNWFKMSIEELKERYGEQIKKNIKIIEEREKCKKTFRNLNK